jgi:hypothetical protein
VLDGLYEHRYLTRRQIQALYFADYPELQPGRPVATASPRPAQRRLHRLRQSGLIHRRALTATDGSREHEPYYCLTLDSATLIAHRHHLHPAETRKRAVDVLAHQQFVRHALAGAELDCALVRSARTHPGHSCLPDWWQGEQAASVEFADRGRPVVLRPDGYSRYQAGREIHHLLIEIDLGTMSLARLETKLDRYRAYSRSGAWRSSYPVFPKLLLLTTTEQRIAALQRRLEPLPELVLLAATHADLRERGPLAAIWQQPGHLQPRPLLEPPR